MKKRKPNWGPWAYGALFTVVLPLLLAGWAWRLDGSGLALWPLPLPAWMGALLTAVGLGLMAAAMSASLSPLASCSSICRLNCVS